MPTITTTLPNDGENADASDISVPVLAILAVLNGGLDDANIASLSGTKLVAGTIPATAFSAATNTGWIPMSQVPASVTALGNRSYSVVFNGVDLTDRLSAGMRFRLTRSVAAPTKCTTLNGSTQFYSKPSPAGMTFTNNFVVSAWIKLTSYPSAGMIASRFNGTSGWSFFITSTGQLRLSGYNAAIGNESFVQSYQSVPLNKWVHVTAQLDMLTFTASTTTSYVMVDGVDVPAVVSRSGTSPTALIQAGNLEIGSTNGGTSPFPGKIAQVAIYSAKISQATILASMHQTLIGTEANLISAYTFNGSINDLNATNGNNLTANGSAVATNTDSPFAGGANAIVATGLLEYAEIFAASFAVNTTLVVQVPDGYAIPVSGGISVAAYSATGKPYGWPGLDSVLASVVSNSIFTTTAVGAYTDVAGLTVSIYVPAGRRVRITGGGNYMRTSNATSGQTVGIGIFEGTTPLADNTQSSAGSQFALYAGVATTPFSTSPGLHTYKLAGIQGGAGTYALTGTANQFLFIQAELV